MKIYKETEIKNPLYVSRLDNGVTLLVFGNHAEGSDGNTYRIVEHEVEEDEFEFLGWTRAE